MWKQKILPGIAGIGALIIFGVGFNYVTGASIGEACNGKRDCRGIFGTACMSGGGGYYCSHSCSNDKECPDKWSCQDVVSGRTGGSRGRVCIKPE